MKRLIQIFILLAPGFSPAQITLLKDINNSATTSGSSPTSLVSLGGYVYYSANDGVSGTELWRSDGTLAGTTRVKDINPGENSSSPLYLKVVGSHIYFMANDGTTGPELWRTDGTAAGTILVSDIYPGVTGSGPGPFIVVNSTTLYFGAADGVNGRELWKTDVTTLATSMISDINAGNSSSSPSLFVHVSGTTVYFSATDATAGTELWKTDGTDTNTLRIKDINPSTANSSPNWLTLLNGSVIFTANDGTNGLELWISNGTSAGTTLLKNINPAAGVGSTPVGLVSVGGYVFLAANDGTNGQELWRTDGTAVNTILAININLNAGGSGLFSVSTFAVVGSAIYFFANDGTGLYGTELYRATTALSLSRIDIFVGTGNSAPGNLTEANGALFCKASTTAEGYELYRVTGTTFTPYYLLPGSGASDPNNFTALDGTTVLYSANNGSGNELWKWDGATNSQIVDLVSGSDGSGPYEMVYNGSGITYFGANDGTNGTELWKTDGTTAGTVMVKNINPSGSSNPYYLTMVGSTLFFQAYDGSESELFKSDGTSAGTVKIDVNVGVNSSDPYLLKALDNTTLVFQAYTDLYGTELAKYSTATSTLTLYDINTGANESYPDELTVLSGVAYFSAENVTYGREVFKFNGTSVSVETDIVAGGAGSDPYGLKVAAGAVYFQAYTAATGYELFRTTGSGATLVKDIVPGTVGSAPYEMTALGTTVMFQAYDPANGYELWKTDGTAGNTVLVKDIYPGATGVNPNSSSPFNMVAYNGKLYFMARDAANGNEIWVTDGTTAGTTLFKDVNPGPANGSFSFPVFFGSNMFMVAADGNGAKVYVTDGRSCATVPVTPFSGGVTGSANYLTQASSSKMVFSMILQGSGRELFLLDPAQVTLPVATVINTHPATQSITQPNGVTFTVAATGSNLTYQWQKNSVNIPTATSSTFNIPVVQATDAGDYRCVVTGTCGAQISNQATLTVVVPPPTGQPTNFVVSNPTPSTLDISFTAASGSPTGYLVLRKQGAAPTEIPVNGTTYSAGTSFGSSVVTAQGPGTTGTDVGLGAGSQYFYAIFSFNGSGASIVYLATNPLTGSGSTLFAEPTEQPTGLQFTSVDAETLTVSFTAPASAPTGYMVIRKEGSAPTEVPLDGASYAVGNTLGDATIAYVGPSTTFGDAGLTGELVYFYKIFSANGVNETVNYLTTSPLQGNIQMLAWEPIEQPVQLVFSNVGASSFTISFSVPPNDFPSGYLAIRKSGSSPTGIPVDRTLYTIGATIGDGTVAYIGTGTTFNESISPTGMHYDIFSYHGGANTVNYLTTNPLQGALDLTAPTFENKTQASVATQTNLTVAVKVTETESGVANPVTVEYKAINSATSVYTSEQMLLNSSTGDYETQVAGGEIGAQGLEFRFKAANLHGAQGTSSIFKTLISLSSETIQTAAGSAQSDYRIIAVPLVLANRKADAVFNELPMEGSPNNWRMYRYENGSNRPITGTGPTGLATVNIDPGKGYWLITRTETIIGTGTGTTVDATAATPFSIPVTSGWNQIGNPYLHRINWDAVDDANGNLGLNLKTYVGGWQADAPGLDPFQGGFVMVGGSLSSIAIPTAKTTAREGEVKRNTNPIDSDSWEVRLDIRNGDTRMNFGGVGMNPGASPGYDRYDDFTLPRFLDYVELNHPKTAHGVSFTRDVVPTAENYTWEFTIESTLGGVTELSWDNSYFGDNEFSIVLWDEEDQRPIDMRQANNYSFSQKKGRLFKIFFGDRDYVREKASASHVLIHGLSPNPTRAEVNVSFSIPGVQESNVRVEVLNLLGQPMATIFEGRLMGGYHEMTWSGRGSDGNSPAAGIYLVQVTSGDRTSSKRLMVIQ